VDCEINCGKNSPDGKMSYCASYPSSTERNGTESETKDNCKGLIYKIEDKKNQLQRLKENNEENSEEIRKLEQEIKALLQTQDQNSSTSKNPIKNKTVTILVIGFALLFLIGSIIYISKVVKPKNPKIK